MRVVEAMYTPNRYETLQPVSSIDSVAHQLRNAFLPGDVIVILREDDYKSLVADAEVVRTARKYRPHAIAQEIARKTGSEVG